MKGRWELGGINQVMEVIRQQVIDSYDWCYKNIPQMESPQELYGYLKKRTVFRNDKDPKTGAPAELCMTARVLFEDNPHGIPGAGDCDDFTILGTACFVTQGWLDADILLAGRTRIRPVHIYNYIDWEGFTYCFDLTEPRFNVERPYKLKQVLPLNFYN